MGERFLVLEMSQADERRGLYRLVMERTDREAAAADARRVFQKGSDVVIAQVIETMRRDYDSR